MKFTMRDKICKLIGKYKEQAKGDVLEIKKFDEPKIPSDLKPSKESLMVIDCHMETIEEFVSDLEKLLEEDDKTEDTTHE